MTWAARRRRLVHALRQQERDTQLKFRPRTGNVLVAAAKEAPAPIRRTA